jgi:hypothetical protein
MHASWRSASTGQWLGRREGAGRSTRRRGRPWIVQALEFPIKAESSLSRAQWIVCFLCEFVHWIPLAREHEVLGLAKRLHDTLGHARPELVALSMAAARGHVPAH